MEKLEKMADQLKKIPHVMPSRYSIAYDQNRDLFYGLELDPQTGRVHDAR